ncbi:MAG: tail fiber protein [Elusimicrobiales bacterium]|nr:tail fiber protein [Elusimicrobiales bacterium]
MGYEPIRVIATSATSDGHVNRETTFDENPLSNKICYRDGLPYMTDTPKSLGGKGPRRVDLNGLFYLFSCFLFELQMGNYPTYNADVVGTGKPLPSGYPLGAVLWYPTGGYFVKSLVANNTESDLTDTTKWAKITVSAADLLQAVPTGSIQPYAGASIPAGWLLCDGSAVSRTDYAALFAAIGTLYGTGDGSTTFNLPDFTDKTFWGGTAAQAGTVKAAGLPQHVHLFGYETIGNNSGWFAGYNVNSGVITSQHGYTTTDYDPSQSYGVIGWNGSNNSSPFTTVNPISGNLVTAVASQAPAIDGSSDGVYGANIDTVQPPAIQVPFIIKY